MLSSWHKVKIWTLTKSFNIFFAEKMRVAFALQKLLLSLQQKIIDVFAIAQDFRF